MKQALFILLALLLAPATVVADESDGDHIHTTAMGGDNTMGLPGNGGNSNPGSNFSGGFFDSSQSAPPPKHEIPKLQEAQHKAGNGDGVKPVDETVGIPGGGMTHSMGEIGEIGSVIHVGYH